MNGGRKKPYKTHTTQKNKKMSNTTPRERERERERYYFLILINHPPF
jgi:hypothetical protein